MTEKVVIVAPETIGTSLRPRLPSRAELRTFSNLEEALALAADAEIGWFDQFDDKIFSRAPAAAVNAKWINTFLVGLDALPLDLFAARGQILTNGAGLRSDVVAEFAVLGVLALAKRLDEMVRAHDRRKWVRVPNGARHLSGSRALIIGYGSIGREIGARLRRFGVEVVGVRRSADADPAVIGLNEWRERLGEFDWVILAAPSMESTKEMIGASELAAMKPGAGIINIARGSLIDQPALCAGLQSGHIGGAFLDTTTPEPLPEADPLWNAPNTLITMHMAGAAQTVGFSSAIERFLANLDRYLQGKSLEFTVDLTRGY